MSLLIRERTGFTVSDALKRPSVIGVGAVYENLRRILSHVKTEVEIRTELIRYMFQTEVIQVVVLFLRGMLIEVTLTLEYS